jgi:hypothetical protein
VNKHHICLPFDSETHYEACLNDLAQYRHFLAAQFAAHPELFPIDFAQGYEWHSRYLLKKQQLWLRRIKVQATGSVFAIRPSFVFPYAIARTQEVERALYLRQWGVPFEALEYVFGRSASFWQRAWLQFGRPSLVGTTVKDPARLPLHLVADEKVTWLDGQEVYVATTAARGCFLGVGLATETTAESIGAGYGEFKQEAQTLLADYSPQTVCTDGFKATRLAWQQLFPQVTLILCFLHGVLKIIERCRGRLRQQVLDRVWNCYQAESRRQFSQRLRRVGEWAEAKLEGAVAEMTLKMYKQGPRYVTAYERVGCARTTNGVDRLMNHQDRVLYQMRYLHGKGEKARLALRAMALQWNFHSYARRLRSAEPERQSPFADMNGFQYHGNWLHNLMIAASLGGHKL